MPATIRQIRHALADQLQAAIGFQCSAYVLANPTPPTIQIRPGPRKAHLAFGPVASAHSTRDFVVQAIVQHVNDAGSQDLLDEFLDSGAIDAALESDNTLGGLVNGLECMGDGGYQILVTGDNRALLTSEWTVTVYL